MSSLVQDHRQDHRKGIDRLDAVFLGMAFLASSAVVWLVTDTWLALVAYAGGLGVLGLVVWLAARPRSIPVLAEHLQTDWSVTALALEDSTMAVAITDRANRLICANSAYSDRFGNGDAPPVLPVDDSARAALASAARQAWRDGKAKIEALDCAGATCRVEIARAGRADDYLVWRFIPAGNTRMDAQATALLGGPLGEALSGAGIDTVLVSEGGIIRCASAGFAKRAVGDSKATMAGQDFVAQLRSDDRDRIFYARDGQGGVPQTLVHVPLEESGAEAQSEALYLMLMLDAGLGVGAGAEVAGHASVPQLESLLAQLPLGLAMVNRDGRFLFANPAFLRAVDAQAGKLPPYPSDLVIKDDKAALADAVRRFAQSTANSGDMAVRLRVNPEEPVSLGLAGVRGLGEAAVLLSLADTTEETRLKRQVAQSTKMQAVGQLAGGVAHDFNNVLTAIIGYCDLMLLRHTPGDSDYDDIQQIRANSNRAASLTRQLLAFSRQQTLRPEVLQLPDIVSEVSQLLKRLLGEKIELRVNHARGLGPIRADPQQLEQVIINLAVNARDAIQTHLRRNGLAGESGGGTLTLSTRPVEADQVRRMKTGIIPIADYTAMVIEDTGGGIPPHVLGKIFEPFFTTKETGKGTGLGLSTVYGIIKQSGGFIFADNVPGQDGPPIGARFSIYLPVHHGDPVRPNRPTHEPANAWSGGGRLLLVEDEDMVRAVAERALVLQGYDVVAASDGEEGLAIMSEQGPFDLVVSDVVMPGIDGPAMARQIRELSPSIPVLFMSGYAEEQLRNEISMDNMYFLPKPFSVQQIADRVASILATAGK